MYIRTFLDSNSIKCSKDRQRVETWSRESSLENWLGVTLNEDKEVTGIDMGSFKSSSRLKGKLAIQYHFFRS